MIIHDGPGDLFASQCKTLLCPTNVAGAMGKGLARVFRDRVPGLWEFYQKQFPRDNNPHPSKVFRLELYRPTEGPQVLLFPTKLHWRDPSRIDWIDHNLGSMMEQWFDLELESIAIPALGCGEGGLSYDEVRPYLLKYFDGTMLPAELYHPQ